MLTGGGINAVGVVKRLANSCGSIWGLVYYRFSCRWLGIEGDNKLAQCGNYGFPLLLVRAYLIFAWQMFAIYSEPKACGTCLSYRSEVAVHQEDHLLAYAIN